MLDKNVIDNLAIPVIYSDEPKNGRTWTQYLIPTIKSYDLYNTERILGKLSDNLDDHNWLRSLESLNNMTYKHSTVTFIPVISLDPEGFSQLVTPYTGNTRGNSKDSSPFIYRKKNIGYLEIKYYRDHNDTWVGYIGNSVESTGAGSFIKNQFIPQITNMYAEHHFELLKRHIIKQCILYPTQNIPQMRTKIDKLEEAVHNLLTKYNVGEL